VTGPWVIGTLIETKSLNKLFISISMKAINNFFSSALVASFIVVVSGQMFCAIGQDASSNPTLTPQMLKGKQFRFLWKTEKDAGSNGILLFHEDGTLSSGTGNANESFWSVIGGNQLIFKSRDGRVATIFSHAEQRDHKWFFSGAFQFRPGVEHLLEEVSPETVERERWTKTLNGVLHEFESSNDQESAGVVRSLLGSLNQPDGMSPAALKKNLEVIRARVQQLVQRGAMDSAASLNWTQVQLFDEGQPGTSGPIHPSNKASSAPNPNGLILYLSFDKPDDNGVVHDESGAGNDGRVFGTKWVADGKFGGAYRFCVTNLSDRIVIPNSDTLNPDNITISAWVKTADNDGFWNRIMDKDWRNGYCLSLGGDGSQGKSLRGKLTFQTSKGRVVSDRQLNDNLWHHVAAAYDGKVEHCYIDGIEKVLRVNPGAPKKSGWDLCIGNSVVVYEAGEFVAFDGLIDEVRIYNRALSAEEIKTLATATGAGVNVVPVPALADNKPVGKASSAERLKQLRAIYDQGLITKDDYEKKVKEILDSL
jgi:hypothetical protein